MGESLQRDDQHSQRLDDELVRDPVDEEETPDAELWDRTGQPSDAECGKASAPDPARTIVLNPVSFFHAHASTLTCKSGR